MGRGADGFKPRKSLSELTEPAKKLGALEWLGEETIHSCREAGGLVGSVNIGRKCDDLGLCEGFFGADFASCTDAVHFGHRHVHEDHLWLVVQGQANSFATVACIDDLHLGIFEVFLDQKLIGQVVFSHKRFDPWQFDLGGGGQSFFGGRLERIKRVIKL